MKKTISRKRCHELERLIRGFANNRRIEILSAICEQPGLSVQELSELLKANMKTIASHIARLHTATLIYKYAEGASMRHRLSPLGISVLKFLRTLE